MSNFKNINVDDIKVHAYNNRKIQLSHNDKTLNIICPRMFMPFGMSGMSYNGDPPKYNIDFEMEPNNGNHITEFMTWLTDLETHILKNVYDQSVDIFNGKQHTMEQLESMYNSNIKSGFGVDKLRLKVDTTWDDPPSLRTIVYDKDNNMLTDDLRKALYSKMSGAATVEISSIWFMQGKFGVLWKIKQLQVWEPETIRDYQFLD